MKNDALILNTAAVDIRRPDFGFVLKLAAEGGLALCATEDMPAYSQEQIREWLEQGCGTAGGCGNVAPIMRRAGLSVAIGANLGAGAYGGLDAQGRFFHDSMTAYGVDMSDVYVHPHLPTGTAFAHDAAQADRKGLAVFLNANNDFDLARFLCAVRRRRPTVVYYMYSGLSERADANGGRDLAAFMRECRREGAVTLADSHTLTGNPKQLIAEGRPVAKYRLLDPLLPEVDVFFTSSDEARLIGNTLLDRPAWQNDPARDNGTFLRGITARYWRGGRVRLFGVTVRDGAYVVHGGPDGKVSDVAFVRSPFVASGGLNLIGAGDAFRSGLMSYVGRHVEVFREGAMDVHEAVSTGNLFAATYVTAPLGDRFAGIRDLDEMLARLRGLTERKEGSHD